MNFEQQQELVARARQARARALTAAIAGLADRLGGLRRAWMGWRTRAKLSSLSDRSLRDIGLNRAEIGSLFR